MRLKLGLLISIYALTAFVAYVFLSVHVAPCLGLGDNTVCYEAWMASQPWLQRLFYTPAPYVAGFLIATVLTVRRLVR